MDKDTRGLLTKTRWSHFESYCVMLDWRCVWHIGRIAHIDTNDHSGRLAIYCDKLLNFPVSGGWELRPPSGPFLVAKMIDHLEVHLLQNGRVVIIARDGASMVLTILFPEGDDGSEEELFEGFVLVPLNLDVIAANARPAPPPPLPEDDDIPF